MHFIGFINEKCENVNSPLSIHRLTKDFNNHFETSRLCNYASIHSRVRAYCREIQTIEILDAVTKVKQLFCLGATMNWKYLKKLRKAAVVEVDNLKRITYFNANNGRLTLHGDHGDPNSLFDDETPDRSRSRSGISYSNNFDFDPQTERSHESRETEMRGVDEKNDSGTPDNAAVETRKFEMASPISNRWTTNAGYIELLNYLIKETENVESPMSIRQLAREFKEKTGAKQAMETLREKIDNIRKRIQSFQHIDIKSKVKLLFALSAPVNAYFLKEMKKDSIVEVDEKNRIVHYKANDGSLELRGDHSLSAKISIAQSKRGHGKLIITSNRSLRSLINSYFERKNDVEVVSKNEDEKEIMHFIGFITEKCENVNFPLGIHQLTKDFNKNFGISRSFACIYSRIRAYCREIQTIEILDTPTKVKQLFCLSATLDPEYLGKLRKAAVVEVDNLKRITHFKANDGRLTLHGVHGYPNNSSVDSDEYSNEEFESEFDSDDENYHLDDPEDFMEPSNEAYDFDSDTPVRNQSPKFMSIDDNFSFDPLTQRSYTQEEIEMREDEDDIFEFTENTAVNTREFETLPKSNINPSTSYTPNILKRKASASGSTSERTPSHKYMNPGEMRRNSTSEKISTGKFESKRSILSWIIYYFENNNDSNAVPANKEDREMWNFISFINEKCDNVSSPLSIRQLTEDFNKNFGTSRSFASINSSIRAYCREIQTLEVLDIFTKVKQLFCLSATLGMEYLKKLRKNAVVEVDSQNRITKYTANNGRLTLHGDHGDPNSLPAKKKLGWIEWMKKKNDHSGGDKGKESDIDNLDKSEDFIEQTNKADHFDDETPVRSRTHSGISYNNNSEFDPRTERSNNSRDSNRSLWSLINSYFKRNNDAEAVSENEKEIMNFIGFITEKCENVNFPLGIHQLTKDFNKNFGTSRSFAIIYSRIRAYCREIQTIEFLDTLTKVKQLFCLSATLDLEYLEKLRKAAVVEVDDLNRITHFKANDGRLILHGVHGYPNNSSVDSDKYSSEEFESEFDSVDDNYHINDPEDFMEPSNEAYDIHNDTPVRNISPAFMSFADNFDFDPPTQRSYTPEEIEMREDEDDIFDFTENTAVNTRKFKMPPSSSKPSTIDSENIELLNYLIEKTENVKSPMSIKGMAREFKETSGTAQTVNTFRKRIIRVRTRIHSFEHIDMKSKVKMIFALSSPVDAVFLRELKKDAIVEVDEKIRITHYKANDGSLELKGEHCQSARNKTYQLETKRSHRSMINNYFKNKNDANAVPETEEEKEMGNLIEFITEKCENVYSPLSIHQLTKDFNYHFGKARPFTSIYSRVKGYCREIQTLENLDTPTNVKQLFCLSATLDSEYLEKLRKAAVVEVDNLDRITHFKANNGRLTLRGDHGDQNETEMRGVNKENDFGITWNTPVKTREFETLPKSNINSSTSHTPITFKRNASASGSTSSKRTKPSSKSMDPLQMDDNFSYDAPSGVKLKPFHGILGLSYRIEEDPDIQQIPKFRPGIIEALVEEQYEEEAHFSLKTILKTFKSLILSLDTHGLAQFQMEIDKRIMEAEGRIEVPNNEVIVAMDFLILELTKHDAPESSEDSISLRDVLLMLRTAILNLSLNGVEVILEMLTKNIDQLKILDERVPVSKVECVLRATLNSICT